MDQIYITYSQQRAQKKPEVEQSFSLFKLPRELRDAIYDVLAVFVVITFRWDKVEYKNANFMRVCQQAAQETQTLFYRKSSVRFERRETLIRLAEKQHPIIKLIGNNSNTDLLDESDYPPLVSLIRLKELDVLRGVISQQRDTQVLSQILQAACETNLTQLVQHLIRRMNTLESDKEGFRAAICEAAYHGHYGLAEILLDTGAELDDDTITYTKYDHLWGRSRFEAGSPIQIACRFNRYDIVKLLLGRGADINASKKHHTALTTACYYGHKRTVELLLDQGAEIDKLSGLGCFSALEVAAYTGQDEMFDLLLENKAKIILSRQIRNRIGREVVCDIAYRACEGGSIHILERLLQHDPNLQRRCDKENYLEAAAIRSHPAVIEWLLQHKVDVDLEGTQGPGSALKAACRSGSLECATFLLRHYTSSALSSVSDDLKSSALQIAALHGHLPIVELLVQENATINSIGYHGTALTCAAMEGNENVVAYLLSKGADPNQLGGFWKSPLHAAMYSGSIRDSSLISLLDGGAKLGTEHKKTRLYVPEKTLRDQLEEYELLCSGICWWMPEDVPYVPLVPPKEVYINYRPFYVCEKGPEFLSP